MRGRDPRFVKTLPQPVSPLSVVTAINVWTHVSGVSSLLQPPSGVAPCRPMACIVRIRTTKLLL